MRIHSEKASARGRSRSERSETPSFSPLPQTTIFIHDFSCDREECDETTRYLTAGKVISDLSRNFCFQPPTSPKFEAKLRSSGFPVMDPINPTKTKEEALMPLHILVLALGTLALGIAEFSMMSILNAVAADLQVSIPEAGHFIAAYATGVCAGVMLMVVFARNLPLKRLLLIIVSLIVVGNALTVFADGYAVMVASRFLSGLPHGAYFGVGSIIASELAKPGKASRDVTLMVLGMTIANLVGVPLGSFLSWAVSWRLVFGITAVTGVIVFLSVLRFVPVMPALPNAGFRAQFRFLTHLRPWLVMAAIFFGNGGFFAYLSYVNPTMEEVTGVAPSSMSLVMAVVGAGMVAGNLLCAKLAGRFTDPALACMGQGVLFVALVTVFFGAAHPFIAIPATVVAAGCCFFISGPEQIMMLQGAKEGRLLGAALAQTSFNAGNALGAWVGGLPIDAGKSPEWSALPGFSLAFTGFLILYLLWWIHREKHRRN